MKLLLVTNLFPTPYDPERGIFTLQLVKKLMEYCEVTVVCPLPWFPDWKFLRGIKKYAEFSNVPTLYSIDNIKVHSPKYPLIPKVSENFHSNFMAFGINKYITSLHETIGFDVVNSQWLYPDSVAVYKIVENLGIPHVATGLGCDVNHDIYEISKGQKILNMLKGSSEITVVSKSLKHELIKHQINETEISVIPNGIDMEKFKIKPQETCKSNLGINEKLPIILYVGRLSEEKNVAVLINAMHKLCSMGRKAKLYLIGDGPLRSSLAELVERLDMMESVIFVGKVEHKQVSEWMGAADYFCLPSLREGCPNVILEALGSGKPVIASRVGAIPDVVSDDTGILFDPEDIDELMQSLDTALDTTWSPTKISESVKNLSWEHAANHYFKVYKKAMEQPSQDEIAL